MSNRENRIVGSALLGLSLVLGAAAAAMEPDKNGSSMQSSASPSLPAFFDSARLPSLQDTWKLGEGEPASAQSDTAAIVAPKPANENKPAAGIGVETAAPAPMVKQAAIPPNPIRAPRIAQVRKSLLPPKSHVGAVPRSRRAAAPVAKRSSPPFTIPNQIRSFGWNSQDQLR